MMSSDFDILPNIYHIAHAGHYTYSIYPRDGAKENIRYNTKPVDI